MARPKIYNGPRVTTAIRMPEDLRHRLHSAAEERDVSANLLAVRAISDFLERLAPVDEVMTPLSGQRTSKG
ncbi:MAG: hypothetical protein WEE53_00260 [Acidimicrobiia bacterium]